MKFTDRLKAIGAGVVTGAMGGLSGGLSAIPKVLGTFWKAWGIGVLATAGSGIGLPISLGMIAVGALVSAPLGMAAAAGGLIQGFIEGASKGYNNMKNKGSFEPLQYAMARAKQNLNFKSEEPGLFNSLQATAKQAKTAPISNTFQTPKPSKPAPISNAVPTSSRQSKQPASLSNSFTSTVTSTNSRRSPQTPKPISTVSLVGNNPKATAPKGIIKNEGGPKKVKKVQFDDLKDAVGQIREAETHKAEIQTPTPTQSPQLH